MWLNIISRNLSHCFIFFPVPICCWESCLWSDHDVKYTIVLSRSLLFGNLSLIFWLHLFIFYLPRAVIKSWLVPEAVTHAVPSRWSTWIFSSHHHFALCTFWGLLSIHWPSSAQRPTLLYISYESSDLCLCRLLPIECDPSTVWIVKLC